MVATVRSKSCIKEICFHVDIKNDLTIEEAFNLQVSNA